MMLTPERSIETQNKLGADIIMALDDVVRLSLSPPLSVALLLCVYVSLCLSLVSVSFILSFDWVRFQTNFQYHMKVKTTVVGPRVEEACHRTLRWIDRCIKAHKRPTEQNLFGIVQVPFVFVSPLHAVATTTVLSSAVSAPCLRLCREASIHACGTYACAD
jgi:queuine tRNA-ribosyltransferase